MDTVQWPQMKPMEEIIVVQNSNNSCSKASSNSLERKASRPPKESGPVNCPRCNSTNTKFCYYNNYSLSQPRYFCKTCRRYWTEGGSLRNVPVGGGSRKNKRSSSSSSSSHSMSKKLPDLVVPPASAPVLSQNPRPMMMTMMHHHHDQEHGRDLNLGFPPSDDFKTISELIQVPGFDGIKNSNSNSNGNGNGNGNSSPGSALELLTGRGSMMMMNSFMPIPIPDPNSVYSSSSCSADQLMIPMPEFKIPSLNFSLDGIGGNSSGGRLLFPFEELKTSTVSSSSTTTTTTNTNTTHHHHHDNVEQVRDQINADSNGFWSGMLGGAGSW